MARPAKSIERTRRIFSAEFKQEAVRRMAERRVSVPIEYCTEKAVRTISWTT